MRLSPLLAAALFTIVGTAQAASTIDRVEIRGLDPGNEVEALMIENINVALSLNDVIGRRQGESRLESLITEARAEAREAMEPFGYYSPGITVDAARPAARTNASAWWSRRQASRCVCASRISASRRAATIAT